MPRIESYSMSTAPESSGSKINIESIPNSVTHGVVAFIGITAMIAGLVTVKIYLPFGGNPVECTLLLLSIVSIAIFSVDFFWQKVYRRESTGLNFSRADASLSRVSVKYLGLLGSFGLVWLMYWVFQEYHRSFYENYYEVLRIMVPTSLFLAIPYFYYVDSYMVDKHDGYWCLGQLILFRSGGIDRQILSQHLMALLIKGFFLPLMLVYMCNDLEGFLSNNIRLSDSFTQWYKFLIDILYMIDVGLASIGYMVSLRLLDNQVRSAEPTLLGWLVALICYQPFFSLIEGHYLGYGSGYDWITWLEYAPYSFYCAWGLAILGLTIIYTWATAMFGGRFSNLTNRGIITNGPYRWTKHPAYISKNLSWWLISIPFVVQESPETSLRHCLLLLGVNWIYWLRAKTEERHLSQDPTYRQYAKWINSYGIFRWLPYVMFYKGATKTKNGRIF